MLLTCLASAPKALALLRKDFANFGQLMTHVGALCREISRRSVFQTMPMKQLLYLCEHFKWEACPGLQDFALKICRRVTVSQACEDGFNKSKRCVARSYNTAKCQVSRAWRELIHRRILSDVHKYQEPDFREAVRSKGDTKELSDAIFKPSVKASQARVNLLAVVSTKSTPPWPTVSGDTVPKLAADLILLEEVVEKNLWDKLDRCWLCKLLRHGQMLLRRVGAEAWYFCLKDVHGLIALLWPAEAKQIGTCTHYLPAVGPQARKLHTAVVVSLDDWEAMAFSWTSPLRRAVASQTPRHRLVSVRLRQAKP